MLKEYVDTQITTKFGNLNIRVYKSDINKETIVFWKGIFDQSSPVFVRVHSECITGDLFKSLQCDCGKQLTKSLEFINKNNGVLIYLRQEGRGIGLFEKIKTYQLQSQGYDTFEANTILGHYPDARSYEMVKTVLDDLNIKSICLITNNPSKISEIAKYGIEIVKRVPLIIKSNKYNKKYFETKIEKFQHFFKNEIDYYYKFQVESVYQINQIFDVLKNIKKDPFLKICIGISANNSIFTSIEKRTQIKLIFDACRSLGNFIIPVLHFSFLKSQDILQDIEKIKNVFPFVERLQLNDLPNDKKLLSYTKFACRLFLVDIPISDNNFDIIKNVQFRNLIKKNRAFITIDNSKGKGIVESKESLMKKIDKLLNFGLNNISLAGGFGPDELDRYFYLRRYYKINFSIDAETKLKTNGKVDIKKVKRYLLQLIRFDDPKQNEIAQTRKLLKESQNTSFDTFTIENNDFMVHPKVFHPGFFPSSRWFAKKIQKIVKNQEDFCEIGCGSGIISCFVALDNPEINIVATDINSYASENTILNTKRLNLEKNIKIFNGDVLDALDKEHCFDSIFWALPFGFLDPGIKVNLDEMQVFDPGYCSIRKFFKTAKEHLKPNGKLLIGFSSDLGHEDLLNELAIEFNIQLEIIEETEIKEIETVKFQIFQGTYFK